MKTIHELCNEAREQYGTMENGLGWEEKSKKTQQAASRTAKKMADAAKSQGIKCEVDSTDKSILLIFQSPEDARNIFRSVSAESPARADLQGSDIFIG